MRPHPSGKIPVATIVLLAVIGTSNVVQAVHPPLLDVLERTPDALAQHQWWRLLTPLFGYARGCPQAVLNFVVLAVLGTFAERRSGSRLMLVLFIASGVVGEIAGYAWKPRGAGSSVGLMGLLGAIAVWMLLESRRSATTIAASVVLLGAWMLTLMHNVHGPPILAGACIASIASRFTGREHTRGPSTASTTSR
jgi:rhomboid protease GluP